MNLRKRREVNPYLDLQVINDKICVIISDGGKSGLDQSE